MKKIILTLTTVLALLGLLVSCDSRNSFLKEFDPNAGAKIALQGDSLFFLGGSSTKAKINFSLRDFSNEDQIELQIRITKGIGVVYLRNEVFTLNRFVSIVEPNYEFEFEPQNAQLGIYKVEFTIRDIQKKVQKTSLFQVNVKAETNIFTIDNSVAIDQDSAKRNTFYAFKITNQSQFTRKFKFLSTNNLKFDFLVKDPNPLNPEIPLVENQFELGTNQTRTFVARVREDNPWIQRTEPFVHGSLKGAIRVQTLDRQGAIEGQRDIELTIFDNLPPLDNSVVAQYALGPGTGGKIEVLIKVISAIDRDAKWGGTITHASFEGYKNATFVNTTLTDFLGETRNYQFYWIEGTKERVMNTPITWRIGYKADQIGKLFPLNQNFDLYRNIDQYSYIPSPYNLENGASWYNPFIFSGYCISQSSCYNTYGKMSNMVARIGAVDNEGGRAIKEVVIN